MRQFMIGAAIAVLGAAYGTAAFEKTPEPFKEGSPVVIVGEVSSQPRDVTFATEKKMQVAVGQQRVDHTLHLKDARLVGMNGEKISIDDFQDKMWVRAEGHLMNDARRIHVTSLRLIGKNRGEYRRSMYFRNGWDFGFLAVEHGENAALYDSARLYPEGTQVKVLGEISSQPRSAIFAREKKLQVAIGPDKVDYTIHLSDAQMMDRSGATVELSDLRDKMWLFVEGTVMEDGQRIKATKATLVGRNRREYRESSFWNEATRDGYIQAVPAATA